MGHFAEAFWGAGAAGTIGFMTDLTLPEIADTVRWLERAVIGLNLCPFAKAPHVKGQVHYVVSQAKGLEGLRDELIEQLQALAEVTAEDRETVLLIVPQITFQDIWLLRDPVAYDVKYQASAQPFLVLGMLVTALAIGHSGLTQLAPAPLTL